MKLKIFEIENKNNLELVESLIEKAAKNLDPSGLAIYLYDVSKSFSRFYHDCPIINAENEKLSGARLALADSVKTVLQNGLNLILVPFLEQM